jgi:hypothetical protein
MVIHSGVILAEENRQLRSKNERQKKKRAKTRSYITTGGILTSQEGVERSQMANIERTGGVVVREAQPPQTRAPKMCSVCRSLAHTARTCPERA